MDEWMMERYTLAKERIAEIAAEDVVQEPYRDFFKRTAAFLMKTIAVLDDKEDDACLE